MNKKGFTLIEIILSITIIAVIATLSIVTFTKKKDSTDKIKNTIISAADVYYSTSKKVQQEVKNNGGFIVFSVEDLINNGVLDKNFTVTELENTLSEEEKKEGKTYEKIVFYYDISNLEEDKITTYDKYIYPYEQNKPFILNLEELKLEYDEVTNKDISNPEENFNCTTDIETLYYLSKDYTKEKLNNYECERNKIYYFRNDGKTTNIDLPYSNIDIDLNDERKITVYPKFNPKIVGTTTSNEIYTCGNWSNEDITLKLEDNNNTNILDHNLSYEWSNIETNEEITITTSENINLNYSLKGKTKKLKDTVITAGELSCDVKIDKISPTVEYDGNNFTIKDNDSGIKNLTIKVNNKDEVNNTYKAGTKSTYYKYSKDNLINKNVSVKVEDNAGNVENFTPNVDDLPSIKVEPVPNTYTKFKVMLKNYKNLNNISISYGFNEDYINNLKAYINNLNIADKYKNAAALDNLNRKSRNIKTINKNEIILNDNNEYTFEIDMLDALYDCIGADISGETKNSFLCKPLETMITTSSLPQNIRFREWFNNLKLDYYINLKDTNNKEVVYKVTSQYNMYFDNKHAALNKSSTISSERVGEPYLLGYNSNGDAVFRNANNKTITFYYDYANNKKTFSCTVDATGNSNNDKSYLTKISDGKFDIVAYPQNIYYGETCIIKSKCSVKKLPNTSPLVVTCNSDYSINTINITSSNVVNYPQVYPNVNQLKEYSFKDIETLEDSNSLKKFVTAQKIAYNKINPTIPKNYRYAFDILENERSGENALTRKVIEVKEDNKVYGTIYVVSTNPKESGNKDYMKFFFASGVTTSVEYYSSN